MKKKLFSFLAASLISLTSCNASNVHHEISEYLVGTIPYTNNFRILQLTDVHIGDKDDQDIHYKFMQNTINHANADMIIVTGDLFTYASKTTITRFFDFMDSQGKPWTVTWGNHDEQIYASIDWMTGVLNNYGSHCLFKDIQDDDVFGNANFAIDLMDGTDVFERLIIMDSNRYHYGFDYNGYDYFHQDQIDWYKEMVNYKKGANPIKSLMFYHIPLPEVNDAWEYALNNPGAKEYGERNENPCPPKYNSGFFDVIKAEQSTTAMFFGHDHINDFRVTYEGVTFSYGIKATNRIYHSEEMLGGQVIVLKNNHTLDYEPLLFKYSEVI